MSVRTVRTMARSHLTGPPRSCARNDRTDSGFYTDTPTVFTTFFHSPASEWNSEFRVYAARCGENT